MRRLPPIVEWAIWSALIAVSAAAIVVSAWVVIWSLFVIFDGWSL